MAQREGEPEENGFSYFDLVNEKVIDPRKRRIGIRRVVMWEKRREKWSGEETRGRILMEGASMLEGAKTRSIVYGVSE